MKKLATTLRCVPRFGYEGTEVRSVEIDLTEDAEHDEIFRVLQRWFAQRGVENAVYDITVDDDGFFAVVNDEAFAHEWGTPIF